MIGMRALLPIALAGAALFAACGAAARELPGPRGEPIAPGGGPDRVALLSGGIARSLVDGSDVPLAGSLAASVKLRSIAGVPGARLLVLGVHDDRGAPVTDAAVQVAGGMRFMDHGDFRAAGAPAGDGTYVAPLQFAMAGTWLLTVTVRTADDRAATIDLEVDLF